MPFIRTWDFPSVFPLQAVALETYPHSQVWEEGGGQKLQPYLHMDWVCPLPQPDAKGVSSLKWPDIRDTPIFVLI